MKKPNISFLKKVEAGLVRHVASYSMGRGGYTYWTGGEKTARAHQKAGYVFIEARGPSMVRGPVVVALTDLGREALSQAEGK